MAVRVAILGAGIFAKDTYLPILKKLGEVVEVVAIWSRSQKTAEETLAASPYADDTGVTVKWDDEGLQEILADPSIDAAMNVLPVHIALEVSQKCWQAGKHVLQEKPIGISVKQAQEYFDRYRAAESPVVWHFAENYRFEEIFLKPSSLREHLGTLIKLDLNVNAPMNPANKYFASEWRRDQELCPGGFIFEGGIHFVAGLRLVAREVGCGDIEMISGRALNVLPERLPPMDTACAWMSFTDGTPGTLSVTFGSQQLRSSISVVGSEATMDIDRLASGGYKLTVKRAHKEIDSITEPFTGVDAEILQFLSSVKLAKQGEEDTSDGASRASPEQGIRDLAVIEALFESSRLSGAPVNVSQILTP